MRRLCSVHCWTRALLPSVHWHVSTSITCTWVSAASGHVSAEPRCGRNHCGDPPGRPPQPAALLENGGSGLTASQRGAGRGPRLRRWVPPSVAVPRQAGTACRPQRAVAQPKTGQLNRALKTLLAISDGKPRSSQGVYRSVRPTRRAPDHADTDLCVRAL